MSELLVQVTKSVKWLAVSTTPLAYHKTGWTFGLSVKEITANLVPKHRCECAGLVLKAFVTVGLGHTTTKSIPQKVESLSWTGIKKVGCGTNLTVFLTKSGKLYVCGIDRVNFLFLRG